MATPTIQDIFEMRKNGQFEEAYEKVLPMYREHHGHYTTLCMFWTATDVCRIRIQQGKIMEAENILQNIIHIHPNLQDRNNEAARAIIRLAASLVKSDTKNQLSFQMEQFMSEFGWNHLNYGDFKEIDQREQLFADKSLSELASEAIYIQRMKQLGKYDQ